MKPVPYRLPRHLRRRIIETERDAKQKRAEQQQFEELDKQRRER